LAKGNLRAAIAFRRESLRYGYLTKRTGYVILINLCMVIFLGSLLVFLLERGKNPNIVSYWNALYMIIITIATVGYGDVTPVTRGGRTAVIITLLFGVVALSAFITLMATRRAEKTRRRYAGLQKSIKSQDHIVVCGWNQRGRYVIDRLKKELEALRVQIVLLCNLDESPIDDEYVFFFKGSPVSEADLRRVNVQKARGVILLADESGGGSSADADARTVLAALTIRDLKPDVNMTAEVLEPENVHHLKLAGVGEILDSNSFLGNLIARSAMHYGLINTVSNLVTKDTKTRFFALPADEETVGKTRREVAERMKREHGWRLVSVISTQGTRHEDGDYRLAEGDSLLLVTEE